MALTRATNPVIDAQFPAAVNRIINGKFAIDQRNAGAAVSTSGTYGPDRWTMAIAGTGVFSIQREADTSYPGEYRLKIAVTTADNALAVGDIYNTSQRIEGINIADLYFGTANATQLTIAFEVESTITGTFPFFLMNPSGARSYVSTFTVNAANTRETKTITLTADTTGTWLTDTSVGIFLGIGLGIGSTYQAAAVNTWSAGTFESIAGMTNFMGTIGNTMRIKNFRLYKGPYDLGVDQRLYDDEFRLCERYYQVVRGSGYSIIGQAIGTTTANAPIRFRTRMRIAPAAALGTTVGVGANNMSFVNTTGNFPASAGSISVTSTATEQIHIQGTGISAGSYIAGGAALLYVNGTDLPIAVMNAEF